MTESVVTKTLAAEGIMTHVHQERRRKSEDNTVTERRGRGMDGYEEKK